MPRSRTGEQDAERERDASGGSIIKSPLGGLGGGESKVDEDKRLPDVDGRGESRAILESLLMAVMEGADPRTTGNVSEEVDCERRDVEEGNKVVTEVLCC